MLSPTLEQVKNLLTIYPTVPVFYEVLADHVTPIQVFMALRKAGTPSFMLESVENRDQWGRYSFIGVNPKKEVKINGTEIEIDGTKQTVENHIAYLIEMVNAYQSPVLVDKPKLTGGFIGYFGYDTIRFVEKKLVNVPEDDLNMPECHLCMYDEIVAFDHLTNRVIVIQNVHEEDDLETKYKSLEPRARKLIEQIDNFRMSRKERTDKKETKVISNITEEEYKSKVEKAKEYNIPIRVGVNSGSLEKHLVEKYHGVTAEGLVESALDKVHMIEEMGYDNLVVSIKSSDVMMCVKAHELLAPVCPYPLHVGITESGTLLAGNIKSSIGLGLILSQGIGDTIRVSLTGDPVEEIKSAKLILKTLGLRKGGIEVVSCPTCGRTKIDLIGLANKVEEMVADIPLDIKVAVMGCVVNGPGEAREADLGIAGGIGEGLLIRKGEIIKKVPEKDLLPALKEELDRLAGKLE